MRIYKFILYGLTIKLSISTSVKDHSCHKSKNRLALSHMLIGRRRGDRILSPIEIFCRFYSSLSAGGPTYCNEGPSNILTYDLPRSFLQIEYLIEKACKSDFVVCVSYNSHFVLFCVVALDQSNTAPRTRSDNRNAVHFDLCCCERRRSEITKVIQPSICDVHAYVYCIVLLFLIIYYRWLV